MSSGVQVHQLENIPPIALVMGGDWDTTRPKDQLILSQESWMRVMALGYLGTNGIVDTAIFAAGLTRGPNNTPEATAQHELLLEEFPDLKGRLKILEEDLGHTTKKDAIYTRELIERETDFDISDPLAFISSEAFMRRQIRVFQRQGFSNLVPVVAEPLVAAISPEYAGVVRRYKHSLRYAGIVAVQTGLLGLQLIDRDSILTEALTARSRINHKPVPAE
jgi:hypothetical protein